MAHNEENHAVGKKGQTAEQPRSQRLSFLPPPPRGGPPWSERGGDKMRDPGDEVVITHTSHTCITRGGFYNSQHAGFKPFVFSQTTL